ncbi:MAG: CARDB domain-containing protein [Chloroflexota bacterium]
MRNREDKAIRSLAIWLILIVLGVALGGRSLAADDSPVTSDDAAPVASDEAAGAYSLFLPSILSRSQTSIGANCRYGVAVGRSEDYYNWYGQIGAGWRLNFGTAADSAPANVEYVPVVWVEQDQDANGNYLPTYSTVPSLTDYGLGAQITARPGATWIVGNEVDRAYIQGDTYPDVYATAYHDVYTFIKERDPEAQVAISALVQVTPGRLQYLDLVWEAYLEQYGATMPVDVWNMHLYILPEIRADGTPTTAHVALGTDPALAILESGGDAALCPLDDVYCYAEHDDLDLFAEQILAMRNWMKEHGQQDKPLILSEYSTLYVFLDYDDPINPTQCYVQDEYGGCFTEQRVSDFMVASFDYMETTTDASLGYPQDDYRLVQQWLWFSMFVPVEDTGGSSNLLTEDNTALTQVGRTFRNEVAARPQTVNLLPDDLAYPIAFTSTPTGTINVALSAVARNNGNKLVDNSFVATFYSDPALTQVLGSTTLNDLHGCARDIETATAVWPALPTGYHPYWVKLDSQGAVSESSENDNVATGFVLVNPHQVFIPIVTKPLP